ncbi:hypothetical protein RN001_012293 [Aquatica leii]|uniref:Uncharacterized protein n=1 Tax=Aquatica leii TaxID=1421715 RepID=A0AAN7P740_9COLE|nr:hypothetical protein RN001_012293 [Aquatica leii]
MKWTNCYNTDMKCYDYHPIISYYNKHIGRDGYGDEKVISMWNEALQQYTSEVWEKCVIHTEKLIQEWYNREKLLEITVKPLIIIVGLNDSSSSESSDSD